MKDEEIQELKYRNRRKISEAKVIKSKEEKKFKTYESLVGKVVRVVYLDHALFLNSSPSNVVPVVKEAIGLLANVSEQYVIIVFNKSFGKSSTFSSISHERCDGIAILRNCILNIREVAGVAS
jgi:hypothetical protein